MFHDSERFVGKTTGRARRSFSARHLVLARQSCSSTFFVGSSVHLLSLEFETVGAEESC